MIMNPGLYKALVDSDCKECWPLVRDVVGRQLLGDNVTMVPYLQDAKRYDLGAIILKEELSRAEKIQQRLPGAIQVGWLEDFTKQEVHNGAVESSKEWRKMDENLNQRYYFEEADQKKQDKKYIRVELLGCEKYIQVHPPQEGSLIIDLKSKGFENLRKFYYIWSVYYISGLRMKVVINDKMDIITIDKKIPIGFQLLRYRIQHGGLIGPIKNVDNKKWRVNWVKGCKFRNPMSALPPLPGKIVDDVKDQQIQEGEKRMD